ncbi:MAG: hypothetical protein KAJ10_06030 [Thermodesulfovibrionia bacterium]|nr:hypothetical protein [Thermodesulfovibrionia bacterium]
MIVGFVIPSSKNKRYLSGSDWVINALDYILKSETCAGNMSQVVITLDGALDGTSVKNSLNRFVKKFPVLFGSTARDYNLAPYWRMPPEKDFNLNFNDHHLDRASSGDVSSILEESVNRQFKNDNDHVAFHLIRTGVEQSCFAMTFDHRVLDARGAEMFLDLFQQYITGNCNSGIADGFNFTASADLSDWMEKFYAGRTVNRKIVSLSKLSPGALPLPPAKNNGFRFRLINFSPRETQKIHEDANSRAGYLMETPYFLSVVIQAVHELFSKRCLLSDSYLVPASVDMRTGEDIKQEMFFNHVSYLFYQVPASEAGDREKTIMSIRNQMYDQIKSGLPKDVLKACLLTRIAPLPVLKKVFSIPVDGKIASFCFSHVGKCSYMFSGFMGAKINNIFHMPRVPVPPGLGFFFNYFNDRLNLVISYLNGLIQEDEAVMLETCLKEKLQT